MFHSFLKMNYSVLTQHRHNHFVEKYSRSASECDALELCVCQEQKPGDVAQQAKKQKKKQTHDDTVIHI